MILAISLFLTAIGFAAAASPEDVAEVAAMVTDASILVLLRKQEYVNGQYMGDTIVFVHKGMRYTIYHSGERITADDPDSAWLAFWVRKDGTSGQSTMDTFSDHGFDGEVDFGIDGPREHEFLPDHMTPVGLDQASYWQPRYDAVIDAALEYKRQVKQ